MFEYICIAQCSAWVPPAAGTQFTLAACRHERLKSQKTGDRKCFFQKWVKRDSSNNRALNLALIRPLLGLYSDTSPHPAGIFQGHLGFFPLFHPYIKFVSKFSHISFFSISVAASWPRSLSHQRWSGLTCLAGLSTEAHAAARRLSKWISLQWTLVSASLPLLSLWLPPYGLPSYIHPAPPPSSNQLPAPHSPAFQAFSTASPVHTPPPTPTLGFN